MDPNPETWTVTRVQADAAEDARAEEAKKNEEVTKNQVLGLRGMGLGLG